VVESEGWDGDAGEEYEDEQCLATVLFIVLTFSSLPGAMGSMRRCLDGGVVAWLPQPRAGAERLCAAAARSAARGSDVALPERPAKMGRGKGRSTT